MISFVMKGKGCRIRLMQVETLKLACKIDMNFDDFFKQDGHITFLNKMASFLNISPTRIKIVSIIPGSVKIEMKITKEETKEETKGESSDKSADSSESTTDTSSADIDLSIIQKKLQTSAEEISKATGFTISEVAAEVHDTKDQKPIEVVPEEQRKQFLEIEEEEEEGETEVILNEIEVPQTAPIDWVLVGFCIGLGVTALGTGIFFANKQQKNKKLKERLMSREIEKIEEEKESAKSITVNIKPESKLIEDESNVEDDKKLQIHELEISVDNLEPVKSVERHVSAAKLVDYNRMDTAFIENVIDMELNKKETLNEWDISDDDDDNLEAKMFLKNAANQGFEISNDK